MQSVVLTRAVGRMRTRYCMVLVTIVSKQVPRSQGSGAVTLEDCGHGLHLAQLRDGFMQMPEILRAFAWRHFQAIRLISTT
jgi:hypothetical protein